MFKTLIAQCGQPHGMAHLPKKLTESGNDETALTGRFDRREKMF